MRRRRRRRRRNQRPAGNTGNTCCRSISKEHVTSNMLSREQGTAASAAAQSPCNIIHQFTNREERQQRQQKQQKQQQQE
ncbi:GL14823 [Drosophila persimilis]|uniref:GL14823 n=1 Tax=Drosophila persimilis TaxID=7234 RepID=B4H0L1_DROPE|nr:GL14823 [Drosophila persimilis]